MNEDVPAIERPPFTSRVVVATLTEPVALTAISPSTDMLLFADVNEPLLTVRSPSAVIPPVLAVNIPPLTVTPPTPARPAVRTLLFVARSSVLAVTVRVPLTTRSELVLNVSAAPPSLSLITRLK